MILEPILQPVELDGPWLFERPVSEAADPVVMDPEGTGNFGLLADPLADLLAGFFDPFLYFHA